MPAGPGDPHRLARQRQRVVVLAVLQRDVAERQVGGVVGDGQRAPVGDVTGLQALGHAELGDGLAAPLEERGVEIAGDHLGEHAR